MSIQWLEQVEKTPGRSVWKVLCTLCGTIYQRGGSPGTKPAPVGCRSCVAVERWKNKRAGGLPVDRKRQQRRQLARAS